MNISLSKAAAKKKKLNFGLNARGAAKETGSSNVLGGDDSSSDSEDGGGRAAVNRDLRAEQEALRKRAEASIKSNSAEVYDYDGVYDQMHATESSSKEEKQEKKSRYIGDLLKAAKRRERERDIIYERKMQKEQAQEEAEFEGKDKFVTASYKRKLAERKLWQQEEEARRVEEEQQDVTKKTGDGAFASFYGNLNRNVAMGGGGEQEPNKNDDEAKGDEERRLREEQQTENVDQKPSGLEFADGFERAAPSSESSGKPKVNVVPAVSMREARAEKLAKARLRYFQRQGVSDESGAQKQ